MILSDHFAVEEFEASQTAIRLGINNKMTLAQTQLAAFFCMEVLEKIRAFYGKPIHIDSGYRCPQLNRLIGGAMNSQHQMIKAECVAVDIVIPGVSPVQMMTDIKADKIEGLIWDQCIEEGTWLHISRSTIHNRGQCLKAHFSKGSVTYKEV